MSNIKKNIDIENNKITLTKEHVAYIIDLIRQSQHSGKDLEIAYETLFILKKIFTLNNQ